MQVAGREKWKNDNTKFNLLFNDTFSTRVLVSKIAEKMKAYGLWEIFVTDSFEEYIDNLVVNTDLELDDNDLFQEEFF